VNRRAVTLVAVCAAVLVGGWLLLTHTRAAPTSATADGLPVCPLATLPAEVADTVDDIHAGGPFPFPRNDGVVFGNREAHLPDEAKGYYHEYTVVTPGADNRSTRRLVTGGTPLTDPPHYYYTGDHYESFCLVSDAGGAA
jgi:ribonuclease T1